jgi:hypothetical protein
MLKAMAPKRKKTSTATETSVLTKSKRRCAMCYHLEGIDTQKKGQIAHLDQNPSNCAEHNLAWLCLEHHSEYDSTTKQHKNYTEAEVKKWRDDLYAALAAATATTPTVIPPSLPTRTELQRQRDIQMLGHILRPIDWPTIDEHVSEIPRVIVGRIIHFWEGFHAVVKGSLFHLYDPVLKREVLKLYDSWDTTVRYGEHYDDLSNGNHIFRRPVNRPLTSVEERDWKIIEQAAVQLRESKAALLHHLREHYPEIDVPKLSQEAWREYVEYMK